MNDSVDFNSDDVLGWEEETDPAGEKTGVLRVMLKDGTQREFRDDAIERVRGILEHYMPPTI